MTNEAIAIGVDVGGSKIVLGIVHADGTISHQTRVRTEQRDPEWVAERIIDFSRDNGPGLPVGVAAAGAVDREGVVRYGTFIPWDGYPLRATLTQRLDVPSFVQNDVTVAAWGEYVLDPNRRSVVVIAAGTGVGGGAVSEGKLLIGRGAAMEIGHLPLSTGTRLCGCGKVGCLETVASGSAVEAEYHDRRLAAGPAAPTLTPAPAVVAAARAGDEIALDVLHDAGTALGEAAALIASVLDPERIVLTGGLLHGAGPLIFDHARSSFIDRLAPPNIGSINILEHSNARVDPIVLGAGFLAADLENIVATL